MSSEIAIKVENLSKCYQIYDQPRDRLKQFVLPQLQRLAHIPPKQYFREFWALKNASFDVRKGETLGIIGRNGSGKSTLLQIICGTLSATSGSVAINGRIAALLELGSGFNPEFTGRENVYLNGSIHGLSESEIDSKYDEIVDFSEIREFIGLPVKTYSSGMAARLAFSSAIHLSPDVLIIDEALSVGDFQFQAKCFEKLKELKAIGTTIIMVSHDLSAITQFSERVVLISNGKACVYTDSVTAINDFKEQATRRKASEKATGSMEESEPESDKSAFYKLSKRIHRSGSGDVRIVDWYLSAAMNSNPVASVGFGEDCEIVIKVKSCRDGAEPNVGFFFTDVRGSEIAGCTINHENCRTGKLKNGQHFKIVFRFRMALRPGVYLINLGCSETINGDLISYDRIYSVAEIVVTGSKEMIGFVHLSPEIELEAL